MIFKIMMKISKKYVLLLIIILLTFFMLVISSVFITQKVYTSKVTWTEKKGFPFGFLTYDGYFGPCGQDVGGMCKVLSLQSINTVKLLANVIIYALISSVIIIGVFFIVSFNSS